MPANKFGKFCNYLGRNNDPVFVVLAIAVFKGVFRPLFTMMDKEEKPEVKKYAAFREGLTEAVAFTTYLASSLAVKQIAKPLCKNAPKLMKDAEKSLSFIAVCLSAGLIIPAVCNWTLKPVMNAIQKRKKEKGIELPDAKNLNIIENVSFGQPEKPNPTYNTQMSDNSKKLLSMVHKPIAFTNSNMKVGG